MAGVHRPPSAGRPGARSISPTQLRSMWRSASQERGWSHPDDWWSPAVDAVTEAIITDGDVAERCSRLGLARARAGVSMAETLDDLFALARLVRALQSHPAHSFATPPCPIDVVVVLQSAAVGWADAVDGGAGLIEPRDVISAGGTLPGAGYLTERLREAAAEAEADGERLGERYGLVVAALLAPAEKSSDPTDVQARIEAWDRAWQMSQLADDLGAVFASGESLVRIGRCTAVVLTRRTPTLMTRVGSLRALIDSRDGGPGVRIWVERLPDTLQQAVQLLTDLRR